MFVKKHTYDAFCQKRSLPAVFLTRGLDLVGGTSGIVVLLSRGEDLGNVTFFLAVILKRLQVFVYMTRKEEKF